MNWRNFFILFFLLVFFHFFSSAQQLINLKQAIELAIKNNPVVEQANINQNISKINLQIAKNNFLPTLGANFSSGSNWGLYIDPATNLLTRENNLSNNANLNLNYEIFNGFKYLNALNIAENNLNASNFKVEKSINDLSLQVTLNFLQLFFCKEQLKNAAINLDLIEKKQKLIAKFVESGVLSKKELLNMEYQVAKADLFKLNAKNNYDLARFNLMQQIRLNTNDSIEFVMTNQSEIADYQLFLPIPFERIDSFAKENLPEIKIANFNKKAATYALKYAQGFKYPTLTLSAKAGTKTSSLQYDYFNEQLNLNQHQNILLSLAFPIYNKHLFTQNIKLAEENIKLKANESSILNIEIENKLKTLTLDYNISIKKYEVFIQQFNAVAEELRYADKSLDLGTINITEYAETRNRYTSAQLELLQAKYDLYFKGKLIDFYQGKAIE